MSNGKHLQGLPALRCTQRSQARVGQRRVLDVQLSQLPQAGRNSRARTVGDGTATIQPQHQQQPAPCCIVYICMSQVRNAVLSKALTRSWFIVHDGWLKT